MDKKQKEILVSEIKEKLNKSSSIYLTDFAGLTVKETNEFRSELYNNKVDYKVVKNTLLRMALNKEEGVKFSDQLESIGNYLKGQTGIIFAYDDPVSPARVIKKFFDKSEKPKLKVAIVENISYDKTKLNDLASLQSKPEIIASILGSLDSPVSGIIGAINAVIRDLSSIIEEVAKKNENQ